MTADTLSAVSLAERYLRTRCQTETLAAPLSPEDQCIQSMPDVSPTKWHRAHTTWFFETFVLADVADYETYDPSFGYLFNSYYEAVGPRHERPRRGLISRPSTEEVGQYRRHVDEALGDALGAGRLDPAALALVELGIHHEQQHQELLLMDIKHVLSQNPLAPAYHPDGPHPRPVSGPDGWVQVEGGIVEVGHDGLGFAFDNEAPRHEVLLAPCELSRGLVTCGDWLEFIDDDGYGRPELWLSDGWATVTSEGWQAPLYWHHDEDGWWQFTLRGRERIDPDVPVCHVSYYEADAFARWRGCRLPTEFEWEHAEGLDDRFGQVWQWTASAYLPYPGFRPAEGAVGEYNGKFMVNQHVLRGSACVTPAGHERLTYRNFFPPSARWPFTGVRLAR
jgi:ergothioneine biosynthesis protein EgtB